MNKYMVNLVLIGAFLVVMGFFAGFTVANTMRLNDNIKHGVMDNNYKWLPGFELAVK